MKILLINTFDTLGGASRAAYRLLDGMNTMGVKAQMLVQEKSSACRSVLMPPRTRYGKVMARLRHLIDLQILYSLYPRRKKVPFSVQWLPSRYADIINQLRPNIVNLHWISAGFLNVAALKKIRAPIVWTLHDMWPFTGGCHYSGDCTNFRQKCGNCPVLGSSRQFDLSRLTWWRKHRAWRDLDFTVVTPSKWLADQAKSSTIFKSRRIEVIANGLNSRIFRPLDKKCSRKFLGLPQDKKIVLFGCQDVDMDRRKGFGLLCGAIEKLKTDALFPSIEFVVFGASGRNKNFPLDYKVRFLGFLHDDISLCMAYSAADLFVAPSLQDNLPNTVMESMACGTPCVAFNTGGMVDMIEHRKCGYLADALEPKELAEGILWVLSDRERLHQLSKRAREKIMGEFDFQQQASKYYKLFKDITSRK